MSAIRLTYGIRNKGEKPTDIEAKIKNGSVIHSMREDPDDAYRAGRRLMFCRKEGTRNIYFPGPLCTGWQKVFLRTDGVNVFVSIDGKETLYGADMVRFYRNEGFNSLEDFINWYLPICKKTPGGISRKLIHWTTFRY